MSLLRPALAVLGLVLNILAGIMALPLCLALFDRSNNTLAFIYSILITLLVAALCLASSRQKIERIAPRQMFVVTGLSWIVVSAAISLPFIFGATHMVQLMHSLNQFLASQLPALRC